MPSSNNHLFALSSKNDETEAQRLSKELKVYWYQDLTHV